MMSFVPELRPDGAPTAALQFRFRPDGELLVLAERPECLPEAAPDGDGEAIHVGRLGDIACRASWGPEAAPAGCEYRNLRELLGSMDPGTASAAGRARALLEWDRDHRHCGRCGTPMRNKETERAKLCPSCGFTAFPRINPAVIVAVVRDGALLLARNGRFRNNMHSLVAGFVEAGETLEETLRREVAEEVGIRIGEIRYVASQAWPFPNTLMLGFIAEYAGGDLRADGEEIVEAGWYRRENLPPIPRPGSLSRHLIETVLGPGL